MRSRSGNNSYLRIVLSIHIFSKVKDPMSLDRLPAIHRRHMHVVPIDKDHETSRMTV